MSKFVDGKEVFDCPDCLDTGWALVVDPERWNKHGRQLRPVAVICSCGCGAVAKQNRENKNRRKVAGITTRCVLFDFAASKADLTAEVVASREIRNRPNYEPAFYF